MNVICNVLSSFGLALTDGYKEDDLVNIPQVGLDLIDPMKRFVVSGKTTHVVCREILWGYCATNSFAD